MRGQLLHITYDLHDFHQEAFVLRMVLRVDNNALGCVLIEILEVVQDDFHLIEEEVCIHIYPLISLHAQGVAKAGNIDLEPADHVHILECKDLLFLILQLADYLVECIKRWDSCTSSFQQQ